MVQFVAHLSGSEPAAEWLANAERFTNHDAERFAKHHTERFAKHDAANHDAERLANPDGHHAVRGKPEPEPNVRAARPSPDAGDGQSAGDGLGNWELTVRGRCATGRSASAGWRLARARAR